MDFARVLRTSVSLGGGLSRIGSGYLVAPGLVLTARHVLQPSRGEVRLGQPCQVRLWPCGPAQDVVDAEVTWLHESRDVALLHAEALGGQLEPLVWGLVMGDAPIEWTALGYPRASRREDGDRVEEEAYGTLGPGSERSTGGLGLTVTSRNPATVASTAAPAGGPPAGTGWAGLSGAAVFCGPAFLGIVTSDPAEYATSLTGVRTAAILEQEDFAQRLGLVAAPVEIRGAPPRATFGGAPATMRARARESRVRGDRVSAGIESWRDRDQLLADLREALLAGPGSPRILNVFGRRGIGKSATVAKVVSEFESADPTRATDQDVDAVVNMSLATGNDQGITGVAYHRLASLLVDEFDRLSTLWNGAGVDALPDLWEALQDWRCVLVLDGLDGVLGAGSGPGTDPGAPRSSDLLALLTSICSTPWPPRVLATSELPLDLPGGLRAHVREFPVTRGLRTGDSIALLRSRDPNSGFADLSDKDLGRAAQLVHGIPLGLDLLGNNLLREPGYFEELTDSQATADELIVELVRRGVVTLDGPSRAVVDLLALAEVPLPMADVAGILDGLADTASVHAAVRSLVRQRGVLFQPGLGGRPRTLRLHPLESEWCRRSLLAGDQGRRRELDLRLARWCASQRVPFDQWRSPEDANPQRMEFRHRWRAGEHDEALGVLVQAARFLARKGETAFVRAALADADHVQLSPAGVVARERCRYALEFLTGSLETAEAAAVLAGQTARAAGLAEAALEVSLELGTLKRHRGDPAAAVEILTEVTSRGPLTDRYVWLDAVLELGIALCAQGRWAQALAAADELADALQPGELAKLGAGADDIRALAHYGAGNYSAALAAASAAAAAYLDTPYQDDAGYLYNVSGLVRLAQGEHAQARSEFLRGEQIGIDYRIDRLAGICATNLAWTELCAGDPVTALAASRRGSTALGSTRTRAARMPQLLVELLSAPLPAPDALASLRAAAHAGRDDPDLFQPSEEVLLTVAALLALPPAGSPG